MKNSDYFGIIFFRKKFDIRDSAIEIPQLGTKHSLNVSVSGGVVLWKFFENFCNWELRMENLESTF